MYYAPEYFLFLWLAWGTCSQPTVQLWSKSGICSFLWQAKQREYINKQTTCVFK